MTTDTKRRAGRPPLFTKDDVLRAGVKHFTETGNLPLRSKSKEQLGFTDKVVLSHYSSFKTYGATIKRVAASNGNGSAPKPKPAPSPLTVESRRRGPKPFWTKENTLQVGVDFYNAHGKLPGTKALDALGLHTNIIKRVWGNKGTYNEAVADAVGIEVPNAMKSNPNKGHRRQTVSIVEPAPETLSVFTRFKRWLSGNY